MDRALKKKDRIRNLLQKQQGILKCPVCSESLLLQETAEVKCVSNHCFDLSKKGTLNLLTSPYDAVYAKDLFAARSKICAAGFYDPLIEHLAQQIAEKKKQSTDRPWRIFDAGCGEGSHLSALSSRLAESGSAEQYFFTGADIAKESIQLAASRQGADVLWIVADLTKMPFADSSLDVVLNIFSPAHYGEFYRVLQKEGMVMKVFPGERYLKELREVFYRGGVQESYSNDRTTDYFSQKMDVLDTVNLVYSFPIPPEMMPDLIKMTPLTWGKEVSKDNIVQLNEIQSVTVDLTIMRGRKK